MSITELVLILSTLTNANALLVGREIIANICWIIALATSRAALAQLVLLDSLDIIVCVYQVTIRVAFIFM